MSMSLFGLLTFFFSFLGYVLYVWAILKGKARPHRVTRFVFLVIITLTSFSLWKQGNIPALILSGTLAIGSVLILILSIRRGMGGWSVSDKICLGIAIFAVFLWQITKNPLVVLSCTMVGEFAAIVPTLAKTYREPNTEAWYFWGIHSLAGIFAIANIGFSSLALLVYPLYMVAINLTMTALSLRKGKAYE